MTIWPFYPGVRIELDAGGRDFHPNMVSPVAGLYRRVRALSLVPHGILLSAPCLRAFAWLYTPRRRQQTGPLSRGRRNWRYGPAEETLEGILRQGPPQLAREWGNLDAGGPELNRHLHHERERNLHPWACSTHRRQRNSYCLHRLLRGFPFAAKPRQRDGDLDVLPASFDFQH